MDNKTRVFRRILSVSVHIFLLQLTIYSQQILPELAHSLDLVEESWKILDEFSGQVWQEWENYKEIAYFTAVPMKQDLLINPPSDPKKNFFLVNTKMYPIRVYLRDPGECKKIWGGAYRYEIEGKRYKGVQFHCPSIDYSNKTYLQFSKNYLHQDTILFKELFYSDNFYKGIIIHEAFHIWQFKKAKIKAKNESHVSSFSPNETFQLLANTEGEILAEAFLTIDNQKLKELTKRFLQIRRERREFITDVDIMWEKRNEFIEGTAIYVETKMLELDDPKYWSALKNVLYLQIMRSPQLYNDENQATQRCYFLGLAQAYILDKLIGNEWKKMIMKEGIYFEDLLESTIKPK